MSRATRPMATRAPLKRKEQMLSTASTRDVRLELDLLEQEETTTQRWSLRFTNDVMERRFQMYHEEISLVASRRACAATIAALLVMHSGVIYQTLTAPEDDKADRRWPALASSLGVNVAVAVAWGGLHWRTRHALTMHGRFQAMLFVLAVCVILIVVAQPALHQPLQEKTQQLTQLMLFLLMLLSSIATLWNIQFLVFCALSALVVTALTGWLVTGSGVYVRDHWHIVVLFVFTLWSLGRGVYRTESSMRAKFLRVRHLLLENIKLSQQNNFMQLQLSSHVDAIGISGIESSGSSGSTGYDGSIGEQSGVMSPSTVVLGESWMENVLKVLHQLKLQLTGQDEMTRELEYVMQTLTSDHDLFRGSQQQQFQFMRGKSNRRYSPGGGRGTGSHEGSEEWLHLIDEQRQQWRRRKSVDVGFGSPVLPPSPVARTVVKPLRRTTSGLRQSVLKQVDNYLTVSPVQKTEDSGAPGLAVSVKMPHHKWSSKRLLARAAAGDSGVDLLDFASVCLYPLTSVLLTTMEAHDLFVALPIRLEATAEFAMEIESRYQAKNPYHNATHGAFVVWDINFFLRRLQVPVSPLQVLSALIAGAVHDVNHPGLSNAYLSNTSSPLAIKYSDDSVLERMHLAEAFQACTKEGCDVFEGLSKEQRRHSRKLIITMVLATDLSGHLKHVNKLKSKRYVAMQSHSSTSDLHLESSSTNGSTPSGSLTAVDDLVFQTLIMMADLGHATKSFEYHFAWSKLVTEEFFRQGDIERQFEMPISPLCDRENAKFDKSQVGFLEFVVLPLYTAARDVLPMKFDGILEQIRANNAMWKRRAESVEKGLTPPLPQSSSSPMEVGGVGKVNASRRASTMASLREEDDTQDVTEQSSTSEQSSSVDESSAVVEASISMAIEDEIERRG